MALSNIFNEPRREITETAIGALAISSFLLVDFWLVWMGSSATSFPGYLAGMGIVGVIMLLVGMFGIGLFLFMHFIGEEACDYLEDRGVHLRPRRVESDDLQKWYFVGGPVIRDPTTPYQQAIEGMVRRAKAQHAAEL